jgi:branched-subunit amino acid transport protein AzlD
MLDRMMGAAMLNVDTFEDVEHDETATGQAALVVVIVAIAQAIGAWGMGPFGAGRAALAALVGWAVWAGITYLIGTRIFEGTATWGEVMRTLGFAQAPGILWILRVVPLLGGVLAVVLPLWIAVAAFIAIRQALDLGNGKTLLTILGGWVVYAVLTAIF